MMARYQDAIDWIAQNDDTSFLDEADERGCEPIISVTVGMVRDLWNKSTEDVIRDLRKSIRYFNGRR
jgi:hypothetical protein